ncbi:MAG: DUF2268 domain-containing putative Zn-dependent protease [Pseudomonadota bacterium]
MGESYWQKHPMRDPTIDVVRDALQRIQELVEVSDLDVMLVPTPNLSHPRFPVSGYCHNDHAVDCSVNPDHPRYEKTFDVEVPRSIVHEVHHALRYRFAGPWTVGENLVLEGLALCAEGALRCPPAEFEALPKDVHHSLVTKAHQQKSFPINPNEDHRKYNWIWEANSPDHVANMYYVGRHIVETALANTSEDAFSAIKKPYQWFFENTN